MANEAVTFGKRGGSRVVQRVGAQPRTSRAAGPTSREPRRNTSSGNIWSGSGPSDRTQQAMAAKEGGQILRIERTWFDGESFVTFDREPLLRIPIATGDPQPDTEP